MAAQRLIFSERYTLLRVAAIVSIVAVGCTWAQSSAGAQESPTAVIDRYRKSDLKGMRLTAGGWRKMSQEFFLDPDLRVKRTRIEVTYGERVTDERALAKERSEVWIVYDYLGYLDSAGRFQQRFDDLELGQPMPITRPYVLVRRRRSTDTSGPSEWRIETFEPNPRVTIDVAIAYLTRMRDKATSASIRGNATKSLALLKKLKTPPRNPIP